MAELLRVRRVELWSFSRMNFKMWAPQLRGARGDVRPLRGHGPAAARCGAMAALSRAPCVAPTHPPTRHGCTQPRALCGTHPPTRGGHLLARAPRPAARRCLLSKRKLQWFVDEGRVTGWDDERMPTIQGLLRRGLSVEGLRHFILLQGASLNGNLMDWDKIWAENRKLIDARAKRFTALTAHNLVHLELERADGADAPPLCAEARSLPAHKKAPELGMKCAPLAPPCRAEPRPLSARCPPRARAQRCTALAPRALPAACPPPVSPRHPISSLLLPSPLPNPTQAQVVQLIPPPRPDRCGADC